MGNTGKRLAIVFDGCAVQLAPHVIAAATAIPGAAAALLAIEKKDRQDRRQIQEMVKR
jgi:hypothetical protein